MKTYNTIDYKECDTCAAKPGSPILCSGCLNNRDAIADREAIIDELHRKLEIIRLVIE